jgi:hypothetical protein
VNTRENFLGFRRSIGRKDIASPKQIVPKIRLDMKPMILCFFDRLGRFSSIFLASQFLSSVFRLLLIPESLETPRKGSSSSSPVPDHGDLMEFRVGNDMEDSFEVREESEVEEPLLLLR